MTITIDLPVKDEIEKRELERYLLKKAEEFLQKKQKNVLELVEVDYSDMPEETKKKYKEVENEYKKTGLKNFTFVSID